MEKPPDTPGDGLRLYDELAGWFHLLTAPEEYADEAAFILDLLREHVDGPLATLLELGSGGGNTASHLRAHLRLTLTDARAGHAGPEPDAQSRRASTSSATCAACAWGGPSTRC